MPYSLTFIGEDLLAFAFTARGSLYYELGQQPKSSEGVRQLFISRVGSTIFTTSFKAVDADKDGCRVFKTSRGDLKITGDCVVGRRSCGGSWSSTDLMSPLLWFPRHEREIAFLLEDAHDVRACSFREHGFEDMIVQWNGFVVVSIVGHTPSFSVARFAYGMFEQVLRKHRASAPR